MIEYGDKIRLKKEFANTNEKGAYAWALYHEGKSDTAMKVFEELNISYSNYKSRL